MDYQLFEEDESNWYAIEICNNIFKGVGDATKLNMLLFKFKEIVDENVDSGLKGLI